MSSKRKADVHTAVARLAAVAETAKKRGRKPAPAKVVQLPMWPEAKRGAPNAVLRSALFAAVQGKRRLVMDRVLLAAQGGITVRYTGVQLTQSDLDVWEQALHLARMQALGSTCYFTARGFLKALGRRPGKSGLDWLESVFSRLSATDVQIRCEGRTYFGSLIEEGMREEETGRYVVVINPKLARFFGPTRWTQIDWEQRQLLRNKPLALWLHGFYASHAESYGLTVEYLHKLSGSQTKQLKHFKQNLVQALQDLQAADAIRGFMIQDNRVHVQTVPSKSQQRHLAARRPPARQRK